MFCEGRILSYTFAPALIFYSPLSTCAMHWDMPTILSKCLNDYINISFNLEKLSTGIMFIRLQNKHMLAGWTLLIRILLVLWKFFLMMHCHLTSLNLRAGKQVFAISSCMQPGGGPLPWRRAYVYFHNLRICMYPHPYRQESKRGKSCWRVVELTMNAMRR